MAVLQQIGSAVEVATRAALTPLFLGLRRPERSRVPRIPGVPAAVGGLAMSSKLFLDEFFFATEVASSTIVTLRDRRRCGEEVIQALDLFEERGWLEDPTDYHPAPPGLEQVFVEPGRWGWLPHRHLRFESGYAPHPGEPGRDRWLGYEANRTAHAWILEHPGPPRPWLVCVPGYRMGHPLVDFTGFRARWLHQTLGLNLAIPVMPLHGPRRVGRRGGDGFFTGDFVDTLHAQAQAVWDVRRLVTWLQDEGAPAVGLYGVSLGGYTAALVASLEEELDCVIAGIPATNFVRLVRDHLPPLVLTAAEGVGFSFTRIERMLRVVSPVALPPRVPRERRYLYAGLGDRLARAAHARELWHHWQGPRSAWYQGGHVSFLWEQEVERLLHRAFRESGLLPDAAPRDA